MRFVLKSLLLFFFFFWYNILQSQAVNEHKYINEKLSFLKTTTNDSLKSVLYNEISEKAALLKLDDKQSQFADSAIYFSKKANIPTLYIRSIKFC